MLVIDEVIDQICCESLSIEHRSGRSAEVQEPTIFSGGSDLSTQLCARTGNIYHGYMLFQAMKVL